MEGIAKVIQQFFGLFIGAGGFFSALLTLFCIAGLFDTPSELEDENAPAKVAFLFGAALFGFVTYHAFKFTRAVFRVPETEAAVAIPTSPEQIILDLAVASKGRLTLAEIAAHSELSVAEAKQEIDALTQSGVASLEYDEEGDIYYDFPGLKSKG